MLVFQDLHYQDFSYHSLLHQVLIHNNTSHLLNTYARHYMINFIYMMPFHLHCNSERQTMLIILIDEKTQVQGG